MQRECRGFWFFDCRSQPPRQGGQLPAIVVGLLIIGLLMASFLISAGVTSPTAEETKALADFQSRIRFHLVLDMAIAAAELNPASGQISLQDSPAGGRSPSYFYRVSETPDMSGSDIRIIRGIFDEMGRPAIHVEFNALGTSKFATLTRNHIGESLAIVIDDKVLSAPRIQSEIPGGLAQIHSHDLDKKFPEIAHLWRAKKSPLDILWRLLGRERK